MSNIENKKCVYYVHPIYDLYASDEDGNMINIIKKVPRMGSRHNRGYMQCTVKKYGGKRQTQLVHRFFWECHNGIIPEEKVIDHINNNREDNRLCNLQLLMPQENSKKSAKGRDYSFVANNHKNKKSKATNITTKKVLHFDSMYAVQQHLQINTGIVKMVCEGINNQKSGVSKKDCQKYKFEYVKKEDMPDNYLKSVNRPKLSDEDKKIHCLEAVKRWQNKEFKCLKCEKVMKNGNRRYHNKKCK